MTCLYLLLHLTRRIDKLDEASAMSMVLVGVSTPGDPRETRVNYEYVPLVEDSMRACVEDGGGGSGLDVWRRTRATPFAVKG